MHPRRRGGKAETDERRDDQPADRRAERSTVVLLDECVRSHVADFTPQGMRKVASALERRRQPSGRHVCFAWREAVEEHVDAPASWSRAYGSLAGHCRQRRGCSADVVVVDRSVGHGSPTPSARDAVSADARPRSRAPTAAKRQRRCQQRGRSAGTGRCQALERGRETAAPAGRAERRLRRRLKPLRRTSTTPTRSDRSLERRSAPTASARAIASRHRCAVDVDATVHAFRRTSVTTPDRTDEKAARGRPFVARCVVRSLTGRAALTVAAAARTIGACVGRRAACRRCSARAPCRVASRTPRLPVVPSVSGVAVA